MREEGTVVYIDFEWTIWDHSNTTSTTTFDRTSTRTSDTTSTITSDRTSTTESDTISTPTSDITSTTTPDTKSARATNTTFSIKSITPTMLPTFSKMFPTIIVPESDSKAINGPDPEIGSWRVQNLNNQPELDIVIQLEIEDTTVTIQTTGTEH